MKKIIVLALALILISGPAFASGQLLFNGVATDGASAALLVPMVPQHTVAMYYTDANASITAITVALEGSIDPPSIFHCAILENIKCIGKAI